MHEEHTIHPNSTIVVLSNVSISPANSNNVSIVGNGIERVTANASNQIDSILGESMKLNLNASNGSNTSTQYFFSTNTPLSTNNNNNNNNNNNTILIDETDGEIIVCNDTITVTSVPNVSTSCATSTCATSCSTPYVIFETTNLPYIQRNDSDRDSNETTTICTDDSGGIGIGTGIDPNADEATEAANELMLKRTANQILQRQSFENVDVIDDEIEEDETSQGK